MSKSIGVMNDGEVADKIARAVIEVRESDQGFGEVKIIVKDRQVTRVIVTTDTKI